MRKVIQSISDKRIFKPMELPNSLSCLIISDKDANKSSAALSVGVGSFSDPLEAQGLAHYLQHMLFMGTQKYPQQNQYSNFLSKNAGSSNAYTSLQQTNFYFQVQNNAFHETLDRFSRFFVDPLMLDSSSQRQLNAVHSQHSKNLQNDSWRKYQLSKHLSKANHPYHKFSTGDKNSLSNPNLRQMLFNFYNSHYSSNLMKLVVYGRQDVDILSKSVEQKFYEVKNHKFNALKLTQHPFNQNTLGKFIKIVPVKDRRVLQLSWVLNNYGFSYKYSPAKYVSYILGNEGKGSLLSFLVAEGLATSLSAGGADNFDCYSQFEISVSLTDKGVQKINEVIRHILYFIKFIRQKQPQRWIFDEIKRMNKMKFDFLQKKQGLNFTSHIARNMHKRKIEEIFTYPYMMQQFRPDLIKQYLNELRYDNLILTAQSKLFETQCNLTQPIYGTKYTIESIGNIQELPCNVHLPEKNIFIPDDLSILPLGNQQYPKKIYQSKFIQAFFKQDHQFELPKAQLHLKLYFGGQNSVKEDVIRSLFEKMLQQKLRQFVYMADQAQLQSSISFGSFYSLSIDIGGFRDSLNRFINKYFNQIFEFKPTDMDLFLNLKQKQKKEYQNYFLNSPYQIAYNTIVNALRQGSSNSPAQKLNQINYITLEDLVRYSEMWKTKVFGEFFMTGNVIEHQALQISKQIQGFLSKYCTPLQKSKIGTVRPIFLPLNQVCAIQQILKSNQQTNSSLIVHYQHESSNLLSDLYQQLAYYMVKQPAFDYLRTKEQLGYIVMCMQDDHRGVSGMSILVQSNIKTSYQLQQYVDKFINSILKEIIDKLDQKTFNQYKNAVYSTKIQKDKNLSAQTGRFWGQIIRHTYLFTRKQESAKMLPNITLSQFKKFFNSLFYENKRIFEMHQIAQQTVNKNNQLRQERIKIQSNYKLFSDVESFRKKMPLYPDYYAHL